MMQSGWPTLHTNAVLNSSLPVCRKIAGLMYESKDGLIYILGLDWLRGGKAFHLNYDNKDSQYLSASD